MKVKRQNHTVVFRGLVLVVAFALAILCMPFNGLVALAQMSQYTDYSYMTIGKVDEEVSTSVVKVAHIIFQMLTLVEAITLLLEKLKMENLKAM